MASFTVPEGTDWITSLVFGAVYDRWRLDDYDIYLNVRAVGSDVVDLELSTLSGALTISDPVARVLEINVDWTAIEALSVGSYEFDVLLENKTTGLRSRNGPHALAVTRGITFKDEA